MHEWFPFILKRYTDRTQGVYVLIFSAAAGVDVAHGGMDAWSSIAFVINTFYLELCTTKHSVLIICKQALHQTIVFVDK